MVQAGLNAGKHVFVEKPLALNLSELNDVSKAFETTAGSLTVGFNRRFAPMIQELKKDATPEGMARIQTVKHPYKS